MSAQIDSESVEKREEPAVTTGRFFDTQWNNIPLMDVSLTDLNIESPNQGMLDKTLICPNGLELLYNDSAIHYVLSKHSPENHEKQGEMAKNMLKGSTVFLLSKTDLDTFVGEIQDINNEKLVRKACQELQSLKAFWLRKKHRTIYLRTYSNTPIKRESYREVFVDEVRELVPILLKEQNVHVDPKKMQSYWRRHFTAKSSCPRALNLDQLRSVLRTFDIDMSRITLVPDIVYTWHAAYQMPFAAGSPIITLNAPSRERVVHKYQAVFKIFQEVVLDVVFDRKVPGEETSQSFLLKLLSKFYDMVNDQHEPFIPERACDELVAGFKTSPAYVEHRKAKVLTPNMTLYACRITDTVNLYHGITRFGGTQADYSQETREALESAWMPVWKSRFGVMMAWNKTFVRSHPTMGDLIGNVIGNAIAQRSPFLTWNDVNLRAALNIHTMDPKTVARAKEYLATSAPPTPHSWVEENATCDDKWPFIRHNEEFDMEADKRAKEVLKRAQLEADEKNKRMGMEKPDTQKRKLTDAEWRHVLSNQTFRQNLIKMLAKCSCDCVNSEDQDCEDRCIQVTLEDAEIILQKVEEKENIAQYMVDLSDPKKMEVAVAELRRQQMQNMKKQQKKKKAKKESPLEEPERPEEPEPPVDEVTELRRKVEELEKKLAAAEQELGERKRKESSGCGKCHRTSEKCEEAKKETKGFRNKVEKLEKKLTAVEKEAKKAEERFGRMEVEVREAKEAGEVMEESMKQLNLEKEEQSTIIGEKDRIILTLKQMVPGDALSELPRTSEMGKVFFDLQMKLNEMRTLDSLGNMERQVSELRGRTQEPKIRQFAEVQRLEFRVGYERYSTAIDRNIAMMQADPLLTREDLLPVPEFPSLSTVFYEQLSAAREANNAQLDRECFICTGHLELEAWTKCPDCTLKFHVSCKNDWYKNPENRVTPCCRRA